MSVCAGDVLFQQSMPKQRKNKIVNFTTLPFSSRFIFF